MINLLIQLIYAPNEAHFFFLSYGQCIRCTISNTTMEISLNQIEVTFTIGLDKHNLAMIFYKFPTQWSILLQLSCNLGT